MSQKTGVAPDCATVLAAATKVSDGRTTSSPGPQPTASTASCSAAVPLDSAIACRAPQNAANSCSNASTRGPMLHHPDATVSSTAARSSSSTSKSERGTDQLNGADSWGLDVCKTGLDVCKAYGDATGSSGTGEALS